MAGGLFKSNLWFVSFFNKPVNHKKQTLLNFFMSFEKKEECGVVALISKNGKDVAPFLYKALYALQHRGQDAAGFAVFNGKIVCKKGIGLVENVFSKKDLEIAGSIGIGHTRYPTHGECFQCDVQPIVRKNIATAHNGHIANYFDLKKEFNDEDFVSSVDSEIVSLIFEKEKSIELAVKKMMEKIEGSFSIVALIDKKIVVFRDKYAIRPMVYGENEEFLCFASETVALDVLGIPYKGDVLGGELVVVDGKITRKQMLAESPKHCMFEYVYFSRPDSIINGQSVWNVRKDLGIVLAKEHPVNADVVIPVPDSSRNASKSYAEALGLEWAEGLIKNRYVGRTFIMPDQEKREDAVRLKLNPVKEVVNGKSVVLVDDSIVRGTTLKEIVRFVRSAGAKEVHLRITCPPIIAPCFYGVDMSTYEELIANKKSVEEIRKFLGADSLGYLSIDGLKKAVGVPICSACLDGKYLSPYVAKLAKKG